MSSIKAKNTKPEIKLRKLLSQYCYRGYRIHYRLTGKPDVVFVSKRLVIFVDGCFWHHCQKCFIEPATRKSFWISKINRNVKRDKKVNKILQNSGWKVLRFWEHDLKKDPQKCVKTILRLVKSRTI